MLKTIIHEDPTDLIHVTNLCQKVIRVIPSKDKKELLFSVTDESGDDIDINLKSLNDFNIINSQMQKIGNFLGSVATRKYRDKVSEQSKLVNLAGLGESLFKNIIPPDLQTEIRNWHNGMNISISSNENWIPWELLHDGKDFLGKRFMLFRLPRRIGFDKIASNINRNIEGKNDHLKIIHIIGGDLKEEHVIKSKKCFEEWAGVSTLHKITISDFFNHCSNADILHLTCHGKINPLRLQITEEDDEFLELLTTSLENSEFSIKPGCLVFANACNSATSQSMLGDYVSFGWYFYLRGASVFIGTLSAIPTELAIEFASIFYQELFFDVVYNEQNLSAHIIEDINGDSNDCDVVKAYRKAKEKMEIPLSICYCFYGNPSKIKKLKHPIKTNIFLDALTNFTLTQQSKI